MSLASLSEIICNTSSFHEFAASTSTDPLSPQTVLKDMPFLSLKPSSQPVPVSYTHLDVYKRQDSHCIRLSIYSYEVMYCILKTHIQETYDKIQKGK